MKPSSSLRLQGLRKSYGSNEVLRGLDLEIAPGSFVGLIGANGAGKSTLIKILDGVTPKSTGKIFLDDKVVDSLRDRTEVAFVHQDLGLVDGISIADNFRLGQAPLRKFGVLVDLQRERAEAADALERVGVERSPDTLVEALSPAEKTLVAIARAFARGATFLVMDEATSNLTPRGAKRVIDVLSSVVADGGTVIMVTHRLSEIIEATSRVVALIDGRIAHDAETRHLDREGLARMLVNQDSVLSEEDITEPGDVVFRMTGARAWPNVGPIDLEIRSGEVVGITGNQGSGLHAIGLLANGAVAPSHGTVWFADGVESALVPPHRETEGGFSDQTILENMTLSSLRLFRGRSRSLDLNAESDAGHTMVKRLKVKPAAADAMFGSLSGGNKQKVIFARAILSGAKFLVLCEPTRGVDPATRTEIYQLIRDLRASGAAILVVSSDSEDLLAVSDRVGVAIGGKLEHMTPLSHLEDEGLEAFV